MIKKQVKIDFTNKSFELKVEKTFIALNHS